MAPLAPGLVEVLVLGELVLRRDGAKAPTLTPTLAETLTVLAVQGRPVKAAELHRALDWRPSEESVQQYISKLKNAHHVPIVSSGPRGHREYGLDPSCRVDARDFVRGVREGWPSDELLRLWRGAPGPGVLDTWPWAEVRQARLSLLQRIAGLPEPEQAALAELGRFADLFPGDRDVDAIRPHGPGSRPRLLVVEDDPAMLREIRDRLGDYYRITPVTRIEDWRTLRKEPGSLDRIDGALVDLHLTTDLNDKRGVEIIKYLRDYTKIPAALFTANGMERSGYLHQHRMAEYRLVDIVDKKNDDWWEALENAARLLVGTGVRERRHRMETWLEAAHRKIRRETEDAPPGSVSARRRQDCDKHYSQVIGLVRVGDIDEADRAVQQFYKRWPISP